MLDTETIRWGLTGLLGLIVYFAKRTADTQEAAIVFLRSEIQSVKRDYLHRDDFREFKAELRGMFDDLKADIKALRDHGA